MVSPRHDIVFVGGGLAAMLLLKELRAELSGGVTIVDPSPPLEQPTVHWSYWSHRQTFYDQFAIGVWQQARVAEKPPEPLAPYAMRLVRSTDVFERLVELMESVSVEWIRTKAASISRRNDGLYEIATEDGSVRARWVFDSAPNVAPAFPAQDRPQAVLSGTGIRVTSDREVFDPATATLFDPLDQKSFAYLLPLSPTEALVESASFDSVARETNEQLLIRQLQKRYPEARFTITHSESGSIPLGFAPAKTTGPQHILLGTKRGLVKSSAGYGIVRIAQESRHLAQLWREHQPLPVSWQANWRWRLMDKGFLELAAHDPRLPLALLHRVMHAVPLSQSLSFIDEELPLRQLAPVLQSAAPIMFGKG